MTFLIIPLLLVLLLAILVKNVLRVGFKISGFRKGAAFVFGERVGAILLLLFADVVAVIVWWYPRYVMNHNAASDDRFGFFIIGSFPFYILGFCIAALALFRLLKAVVRGWHGFSDGILVACGGLLAAVVFSPLLMFGWRIYQIR